MVATTCEKRPDGFLAVPLNIRCSRKCARPDLPGVSSAAPTRYQSMWVTTGARWSGITTTWRPLASTKSVGHEFALVELAVAPTIHIQTAEREGEPVPIRSEPSIARDGCWFGLTIWS